MAPQSNTIQTGHVQNEIRKRVQQTQKWRYVAGRSGGTARRKLVKYEEGGMEAILDKRVARKGESRAPTDEIEAMLRLRREKYRDYSIRHFYEKWVEKHDEKRIYNWVRLTLQGSDLAEKLPGRGKHRKKRERKWNAR